MCAIELRILGVDSHAKLSNEESIIFEKKHLNKKLLWLQMYPC